MPFQEKLTWQSDRVLLGDLVFRLEHARRDDWDLGDQCFLFYKTKPLVDQYDQFWLTRPGFAPTNILELGIWDGGSLAFWFEAFHPAKLVGIDIQHKQTSAYLQAYIARASLADRLKIYWETNQADAPALRRIIADEFQAPLDLIIDDASHQYDPTKASFETLFPLLRPGGLYIIEDWAWAYWRQFRDPGHPLSHEKPLTDLVRQFVAAAGSWSLSAITPEPPIAAVVVFQGFAVIERGGLALDPSRPFVLEDHIIHEEARPTPTGSGQPGNGQELSQVTGRELADRGVPLRSLAQAMALRAAKRPGFQWLRHFKRLGKRLIGGTGGIHTRAN